MNEYIQYLLDYKHRYSQEQLAKLRKEDVEELYQFFASGKAGVYDKKVIQILAAAAPDRIRRDLEKMVADEDQAESLRLLSAAYLNSMFDKKTEAIFLKVLSRPNLSPSLQLKLIKGLGKFGGAKSLELLTGLKQNSRLESLMNLAKLLISARQKRPLSLSYDLDPAPPHSDGQGEPIKPALKDAVALAPSDRYGIELSDKGYFYTCGGSNYVILPGKAVDSNGRESPQIAGLIAVKSLYDDTYLPTMVILLLPREKEDAQMLVFRTDGLLGYGGVMQKDGRFTLITQKRFAGDQVYLRGKWDKGRLVVEEFSSSRQVTGKKKPAPLSFKE